MPERFLYQPFRLGRYGAVANTSADPTRPPTVQRGAGVAVTDDLDRHLRDKVLAVLFTAPGERVNRPDFGVGLNRTVFETLDDLTLAGLEFHVSQGLERELGEELLFDNIELVSSPDNQGGLELRIEYRRRTDRVARMLEVKL